MRSKVKKDILSTSIHVRHPEFFENIEILSKDKNIRGLIEIENRGYGVNRSTIVQWCVNYCANMFKSNT